MAESDSQRRHLASSAVAYIKLNIHPNAPWSSTLQAKIILDTASVLGRPIQQREVLNVLCHMSLQASLVIMTGTPWAPLVLQAAAAIWCTGLLVSSLGVGRISSVRSW